MQIHLYGPSQKRDFGVHKVGGALRDLYAGKHASVIYAVFYVLFVCLLLVLFFVKFTFLAYALAYIINHEIKSVIA
jgi:hypothetical protein